MTKTILTVQPNQCKWPVSGSGADAKLCGKPRKRGSYCEEHARKATGSKS